MNYVVMCEDHRQGDTFIVGPFASMVLAYAWASGDADEKAESFDMRSGIDADGTSSVSIVFDDDLIYSWDVMLLVSAL